MPALNLVPLSEFCLETMLNGNCFRASKFTKYISNSQLKLFFYGPKMSLINFIGDNINSKTQLIMYYVSAF